MQKSYSEKLKDPRWQKKRLNILNRDGFSCQWCGDKEHTLHVHHLKYKGDPWDAPDEWLLTICEDCHETDHALRDDYESDLIQALKLKGYGAYQIQSIACDLFNSTLSPETITMVLQKILNNKKILNMVLSAMGHPSELCNK